MSWEDPRIDQQLFKFKKDKDVIVTLTSAGDQVLDYLIEAPKKIIAVDLNARQNALLELKLAGIRSLSHEQFWQIFGASSGPVFREVYPILREHLSERARAFWDEAQDLFDNKFLWSGACGNLVRYGVMVIRYVFGLNDFYVQLKECKTLEEQRLLTERNRSALDRLFWFMHLTRRLWAPFIAVPASQLDLFKGNIMSIAVYSVLENTHVAKDNYFYYGQLYGVWARDCCPRFLQETYFNKLKSQSLADRVTVYYGLLGDSLASEEPGSITCMSLLDHMDWLSDEVIVNCWEIYRPKLAPGARILWRSFSDSQHIASLAYLDFEQERVTKVIKEYPDRVCMYNTTFFATVPDAFRVIHREPYCPPATVFTDLSVLYNMWLKPISGADHASHLDSFYGGQADTYDKFRYRFLHGRWPMAVNMPTFKDAVWVDMGGGTGSNVEFFNTSVENFSKVYVLDLCEPLLKECRKRITANKWDDRVVAVHGDATDESLVGSKLPKAGTVDLITFSYSLTMIPDWKKSLDIALRMLKPGGYIAVSDFTVTRQHSFITRMFWPFVFKHDHVILRPEHTETLKAMFQEVKTHVDVGGFPYVPLLKCPWYYYVGRKPVTASS
jgi:S-adenosylmethionine:diacylglycerol 3-amino-3-carboxypropyl transferase/ubiquinone/menaquinone biosynthesis C-methylase UbiE